MKVSDRSRARRRTSRSLNPAAACLARRQNAGASLASLPRDTPGPRRAPHTTKNASVTHVATSTGVEPSRARRRERGGGETDSRRRGGSPLSPQRDVSPCPWLRNGEPPRSARRTRSVARGRVSVSVAKTSTTSASWRADDAVTGVRGTASGSPRTRRRAPRVGAGVKRAAEYPHVHATYSSDARSAAATLGAAMNSTVWSKTPSPVASGCLAAARVVASALVATGSSPSARDADAHGRHGGRVAVARAVTRFHLQAYPGDRDATHERSLNRHARGLATQGRDERLSVSFPSRDGDRGGARVRGRVGGDEHARKTAQREKERRVDAIGARARLDRDAAIA